MTTIEKQKIIAYLAQYVQQERLEKLRKNLLERTKFFTVILENINQTHNISAALRSCDCFAIQEVHIIESIHKYEVNENISKGANKWLDINRYNQKTVNNTEICLSSLKNKGYKIVATTPHATGYTIDELPIDQKSALIFGTEEYGLSKKALEMADAYVTIPMFGFTQSFNISVSVALCLYELTKKLRLSNYDWHLTSEEMIDLELKWLHKITGISQLNNIG